MLAKQSRFLAGVLLPVGLVAIALVLTRSPHNGGNESGNTAAHDRTLLQSAGPCGGQGEATTVSALVATVPYHLLMPSSARANAALPAKSWRCSSTESLLQFASGVSVDMDVNTIPNPAASWEQLVASDPIEATLATVQGQSAVVMDPTKDPTGQALGSVTFVENGTWVCVIGNGKLSVADLVSVANSLEPVEP